MLIVIDELAIPLPRRANSLFLHPATIESFSIHDFAITVARGNTTMITLALQAMATRFELVLPGDSPALRAAGEEALAEIARIESMLSLYKASSEVANLNARAAREPVRVSVEMFALLERSVALSRETNGAFDITIAPLVRCWGFMRGQGAIPSDEQIEEARAQVGYQLLQLSASDRTVQFRKPGGMLDFGAFGKGYAVDRAIEILHDAGVTSALLHGGTSTVYGFGKTEDESLWKIAVTGEPPNEEALWIVELNDRSLSVSAIWGKSFASQGRTFGHILDARTGRPAERAELAAVTVHSAADSDALSTALLVEGPAGLQTLAVSRSETSALILSGGKLFRHRIASP